MTAATAIATTMITMMTTITVVVIGTAIPVVTTIPAVLTAGETVRGAPHGGARPPEGAPRGADTETTPRRAPALVLSSSFLFESVLNVF